MVKTLIQKQKQKNSITSHDYNKSLRFFYVNTKNLNLNKMSSQNQWNHKSSQKCFGFPNINKSPGLVTTSPNIPPEEAENERARKYRFSLALNFIFPSMISFPSYFSIFSLNEKRKLLSLSHLLVHASFLPAYFV